VNAFEAGSLLGSVIFGPIWATLLLVAVFWLVDRLLGLFLARASAASIALYVAIGFNLLVGLLSFMGGLERAAEGAGGAANYLPWIDFFAFIVSVPLGVVATDELKLRRQRRDLQKSSDTKIPDVPQHDFPDVQ